MPYPRINRLNVLDLHGRIDSQRAERADQQQPRRDEERQLVASGPLDEHAEHDRRDHAGDAEAGVHHPAGGARIPSGDVERQRPEHGVGQLEKEERRREQIDGAERAAGDDRRQR